ncbi:hypothetical protein LTR95_008880 [Oleoguttula sp. CCFEE 5521]
MAAPERMQDTSKTIATETDEPITTLRSSISSWDVPSSSTSTASRATPSDSDTSPPNDHSSSEPKLSFRVKALEAVILKLSLRLSTLEDSRGGKRSVSQSDIDAAEKTRNINAKRPQRQDSGDWFETARTSPSRLGPNAGPSPREVEGSLPRPPVEEPDIFTSLIRSINATRPQHQESEDFLGAARSSHSGTSRRPETWDYTSASKISQQSAGNVGVSAALASEGVASVIQRHVSEDSFEVVRRMSLSTTRRPGTWDPRLRAAEKAADDDAEKGVCWPDWADDDLMESNTKEKLCGSSAVEWPAERNWKFWRPQHPDPHTSSSTNDATRNPHSGPKSCRHRYDHSARALEVDEANFPALPAAGPGQPPQPEEPWTSIPGLGTLPLPLPPRLR